MCYSFFMQGGNKYSLCHSSSYLSLSSPPRLDPSLMIDIIILQMGTQTNLLPNDITDTRDILQRDCTSYCLCSYKITPVYTCFYMYSPTHAQFSRMTFGPKRLPWKGAPDRELTLGNKVY